MCHNLQTSTWTIALIHPQKHIINLHPFNTSSSLHTIELTTGELSTKQTQTQTYTYSLEKKICELYSKTQKRTLSISKDLSKKIISQISTWTNKFTLGCRINFTNNEIWVCDLEQKKFKASLANMKNLEKRHLKYWSRTPYFLGKKIILNLALLKFITEKKNHAEYQQLFCNLLKNTNKKVQPFSFNNKPWQNKICSLQKIPTGDLVSKAIFYLASEEISKLTFLNRKLTKTAFLTVKLPSVEVGLNKLLWVSLHPLQDTLTKINQVYLKQANTSCSRNITKENLLWHPLIDNLYLTKLSFLSYNQKIKNSFCIKTLNNNETIRQLSSYILDNIIGESSFYISNGYKKKLTLPLGSYKFSIYKVPKTKGSIVEVSSNFLGSGTLVWKSKRRYNSIIAFDKKPQPKASL
jgi:hypothetical protein